MRTSAKPVVKWVSTIAAIACIGAMLYVTIFRNDGRAGYVFLAGLIVCSFAFKWAARPPETPPALSSRRSGRPRRG